MKLETIITALFPRTISAMQKKYIESGIRWSEYRSSKLKEVPVCDRCDFDVHKNYSKYANGTLCKTCYDIAEKEFQEQEPKAA